MTKSHFLKIFKCQYLVEILRYGSNFLHLIITFIGFKITFSNIRSHSAPLLISRGWLQGFEALSDLGFKRVKSWIFKTWNASDISLYDSQISSRYVKIKQIFVFLGVTDGFMTTTNAIRFPNIWNILRKISLLKTYKFNSYIFLFLQYV